MICPNCGQENDNKTRFCINCGKELNNYNTERSKNNIISSIFGEDNVITRPKIGEINQKTNRIENFVINNLEIKSGNEQGSIDPSDSFGDNNPFDEAKYFMKNFEAGEIDGKMDFGKQKILNFPQASSLFLITLPSDFVEKALIRKITENKEYLFTTKTLIYTINTEMDEIKTSTYNNLFRKPPSPPRTMKEGHDRWIETEGNIVWCHECNGRGTIDCPRCAGNRKEYCPNCGGDGYVDQWDEGGRYRETCYSCGGTGIVRCNQCDGRGQFICSNCEGSGKIMRVELYHMDYFIDEKDWAVGENIPYEISKRANGSEKYKTKTFERTNLPMCVTTEPIVSRCEVNGKGIEMTVINYTYKDKDYTIYWEKNGGYYWIDYPLDWLKISITIFILLIISMVIIGIII